MRILNSSRPCDIPACSGRASHGDSDLAFDGLNQCIAEVAIYVRIRYLILLSALSSMSCGYRVPFFQKGRGTILMTKLLKLSQLRAMCMCLESIP